MSILSEKEVIAQAIEVYNYQEGDKIPVEVIDSIISEYATGTKAYRMKKTIYCESFYNNVQSYIVSNGVREPSYGLSQIHLPSHPSVTKEQALDVRFAIWWMSENWENTKWFGYNRTLDKCNH